MLISGLQFAAAIVVPGWAASRFVGAMSSATGPRRLVETLVAALLLVQLATQGMGLTGNLNPGSQVACLVVMALVAVVASRFGRTPRERMEGDTPTVGLERWQVLLAAAFLAVPIMDWYRTTLSGPTIITADDSNYHLSMVLIWLRQGYLSLSALDQASTFPFGAELIPLWLMLPFAEHSAADMLTWTSVTALPWMALMVASIALIAHTLGGRAAAWLLPSAVLFSSWAVRGNAASFASVDNALPACVLAALAMFMSLSAARVATSSDWYRRCLPIAAAIGLAAGIKFTALPLCAVLGVAILREAWRAGRLPRVAATFGLIVGFSLIIAGYWYARNALVLGNPFYPAKFLGLPYDTFVYDGTTLVEHVKRNGWSRSLPDILHVFFDWPPLLGIIGALGLVAGPIFMFKAMPERRRLISTLAAVSWGMLLVTVVLLPTQPWSAGCDPEMKSILNTNQRYVELIFVLGWTWLGLSLGCVQGYAVARGAATAVLFALIAISDQIRGAHPPLKFIGVTGGVLAALLFLPTLAKGNCRFRSRPLAAKYAPATALLLLLVFWQVRHSSKRQAIERVTMGQACATQIADEVRVLEELPRGRVATEFGRHVVLMAKPKHDPVFVGFSTMRPVHIGDAIDTTAYRAFGDKTPYDVRPHLAEADIVFAFDFGGNLDRGPFCLYNVTRNDASFELLRQGKYAAVFVRKASGVAANR